MQYRSLVMSDITSDFPGLKSYSRRPICVPNGHKHPIGTGDTLLEYKKDKPKNQILFFSAISFRNMKKNKLLQIKRRFSRIDLFLKKECAGGT